VHAYIDRGVSQVDHVEVPYELLRHDPRVVDVGRKLPIILHCASLSIAGTRPCSEDVIGEIAEWARQTKTPWIGEHLAFITASRSEVSQGAQPYAPAEPYNIGYTVSPPMNPSTVARAVRALTEYARRFSVPIIVENSPLYFASPGSTMRQSCFIGEVCERANAGLLLDLSHFCITCNTTKVDPIKELESLPLRRVMEVHISGVEWQSDAAWDDHTSVAPDIVYELLELLMEHATPRAITLEYNWSARFPDALFSKELERVRSICKRQALQ
jgi:hypothetical protein